MKLKVQDTDIATGYRLIAILNVRDAKKYDLHHGDRIKITKGRKIATVVLNIAESKRALKPGTVGLFAEVMDNLKLKQDDIVEVTPAKKPLSIEYIRKKLDGKSLTRNEIHQIVWDIVHDKLSSIELTYFVAASYMNAMSSKETIWLTQEMTEHGDVLKLKRYPIIDKHSIGGVPGNRTTMIIVPIVSAAGLTVPKTSSRSITSPAGTADTMEVLAPVSFSLRKMKSIVEKIGGCIVWGGSLNLAPADDKIIRVEKPLGIDAESQLLASIMAKKHSVSSTHLLIDIPVGKDVKVQTMKEATRLAREFQRIGKRLGKKVTVIGSDGRQPIGNGIGPALEARDVLHVLQNDDRAPGDLMAKSVQMAGLIFEMVGRARKGHGRQMALDLLQSGAAFEKMKQIIKAQKGDVFNPDRIKVARLQHDIRAKRAGTIRQIDNEVISKVARIAGAPDNKRAGLFLHKHVGDIVKKGEKVYTIYAGSQNKLDYAVDTARAWDSVLVK